MTTLYVKNNDIPNLIDVWNDTETNRQRLASWGLEEYLGETELGYDGNMYIAGSAPIEPEKTYTQQRTEEYPSITEQLDMLYWDNINGTNDWQTAITAIKNKYPKVIYEI